MCGNPPSYSNTSSIYQLENGVARVGLSVPGEIIDSTFFEGGNNALTDVPVRHNTYCLMM